MPHTTQCDFFLLRYVPDAVKDEFINIGLVLRSPQGAEIRFTRDYSRVLNLDPEADIQWVESLEKDIRTMLASPGEQSAMLFKKLEESFSNTIQFSAVKGLDTDDMSAEADKLMQIYLETARPLRTNRAARESARQHILVQMRNEFELAGVWENMRQGIAAADFTHPGDPLKFDCGYSCALAHKKVRMFHAVAIESGTEPAKSLGYTWPAVRDGILMKESAVATLTAIIHDGLDPRDDRIAFSLSTFMRTGLKVATLAEMPQLAEQARRELGI